MKWFFIGLAVLVAIFRVVLVFTSFNHHIEVSYQALAHGLTFGLLGWWLRDAADELKYQSKVLSVVYVICSILMSPLFSLLNDEFDDPDSYNPQSWTIHTVTCLTWVEIVCAVSSRM